METIQEAKERLSDKFATLSEIRQKEIADFYERNISGVVGSIIRGAKSEAESTIRYADYKGYGYGEVGYNLNENVKEFAEDVPELEKEYEHLLNAYFEFLIESKDI